MSDVVFGGKIPIPKYVQADLTGSYVRGTQLGMQQLQLEQNQDKIDLQRDALKAKQKAAQAEKIKNQQAEQAKIMAQLGGLYQSGHRFATPFLDEAYGLLMEDLKPLMYQPNGSDMAKFYIQNWKRDAEKYLSSSDMLQEESRLTSMIDPSSPEWMAAKKEVGPLYKPLSTPEMLASAQDYQYRGLMQDAKLEYNNGGFTIKGLAYDPKTGLGQEPIALEDHPRFNDKTVFAFDTEGVSTVGLPALGKSIQNAMRVGDNKWDWETISTDYRRHYDGELKFDDIDRETSEPYQYRFEVFTLGKDQIRQAAPTARDLSAEDLLDIYSLNPKYQETMPTVYNLVKQQLKSYWETDLKPHTKWDTDADDQKLQVQLLGKSQGAPLAYTQLPRSPFDDQAVVSGLDIPAEVANGTRKMQTASYSLASLPAKQMESLSVPMVNPKYYRQMKIYEKSGLIIYDPLTKMPIPNSDPAVATDPEMMRAVIPMLEEADLITSRKINALVAYEGNEKSIGVVSDRGDQFVIDLDDISTVDRDILAAINVGLDKMQLEWKDIYNHAVGTHFNSAAGPSDPLNIRGQQ